MNEKIKNLSYGIDIFFDERWLAKKQINQKGLFPTYTSEIWINTHVLTIVRGGKK